MRTRKARVRREFLHLEAQFQPKLIEECQWQFLEGLCNGTIPENPISIGDQLRLLERIRTRHARRDRYNAQRRRKKLEAIKAQMRPEILLAAIAIRCGLVPGIDIHMMADLLAGATGADLRLTKKFFHQMEAIYEMISPAVPPHRIDRNLAQALADSSLPTYENRIDFESQLVPTPIPQPSFRPTGTEQSEEKFRQTDASATTRKAS